MVPECFGILSIFSATSSKVVVPMWYPDFGFKVVDIPVERRGVLCTLIPRDVQLISVGLSSAWFPGRSQHILTIFAICFFNAGRPWNPGNSMGVFGLIMLIHPFLHQTWPWFVGLMWYTWLSTSRSDHCFSFLLRPSSEFQRIIMGHNGPLETTGALPSGKHTKNYGKSSFFMGKSTINGHFQ